MCRLGGVISAQKVLFFCLFKVLSTFCVLVSVINPIFTLRSLLFYLSHFVANFVVFASY